MNNLEDKILGIYQKYPNLEEEFTLRISEKYFGKDVNWFLEEYGFKFGGPAVQNFFDHKENIEFLLSRPGIQININRLLTITNGQDYLASGINNILFQLETFARKRDNIILNQFFLSDETGLTLSAYPTDSDKYLKMISDFIVLHVFMDILGLVNIKELVEVLENDRWGVYRDVVLIEALQSSRQFMVEILTSSPCWVVRGIKSDDIQYMGKGHVNLLAYEESLKDVCAFSIIFEHLEKPFFILNNMSRDISISWNEKESEEIRREIILEIVSEEQKKIDSLKDTISNLVTKLKKREEEMVFLPTELELKLGLDPIFPKKEKDDKE